MPNSEKQVFQELQSLGINSYLPLMKKRRKWRNRTIESSVPLFSGYIFLQVNRLTYIQVLNIQGVIRFLTNNGKLCRVRESEITEVRRVERLNQQYQIERVSYFEKGNKVSISNGPFSGFEGEIVERKGKYRLLVRLKSIREAISIDVEEHILKAIG